MSNILLVLQYCAGAFTICLIAFVGGLIAYKLACLIYGQREDADSDQGAGEGDIRHFHLRSVEDEFHGEGR
ncbi:MAG TPA: hypothetical protein VGC14_02440 [Rhizobium sp.]